MDKLTMYPPLCDNRAALAEWDRMHDAAEARAKAIDAEFLTLIDDHESIDDAIREQADLIAVEFAKLRAAPANSDAAQRFASTVQTIIAAYLLRRAERIVDSRGW